MNEQGISQKTLSSLSVLFKDRFDILLDFLAKKYPITFNKIIEQSVALQARKPAPLLQQLQAGFQKGGLFGLVGTITNKLFKKVDPTKQADKNLSELFQNQDTEDEISYEGDNTRLKAEPVVPTSIVQQPETISQNNNKQNVPKDYFKDITEPIPFKFDGFTDDGETALWNVFPPLFKDIFKDILRGMPTPEEAVAREPGPKSTFQEKGLVGTIMDWFDYGEDFFPGRGGPRRGSTAPRSKPGKGGFFRNLARGVVNVGRLPAGPAALGKAGAAGLAGTAAAVVGGEIIGGQIGKAIGSSETVSEALYGSKTAGKEAYEQYGTGITGFLRASWDLGKQLITNKQAETETLKQKQEIIQKDKTLNEPTKRRMSIGVQKQLDEQIQYIEQIKNNTTITKEEKESRIRQVSENVLLLKRRLEALKPASTPPTKPEGPNTFLKSSTPSSKPASDQTKIEPVQSEQTQIIPTFTEKESFKEPRDSKYDTKSSTDQKKAEQLRQATQTVGTDNKDLLRDTTYNIQYNTQNQQNQIKPDAKQTVEPIPIKVKAIQPKSTPQVNISNSTPQTITSNEPVSLKLYNNDNDVLKQFQDMQYKHLLGMKDMLTSPNAQVTPTPLVTEQQTTSTPTVAPTPAIKPDINPIQIDKLENLKDVKIPDNANILTDIASNTESTNNTLKNLNGAILKLAQVFNDKLDKTGGKNNFFINGQPQQNTYPNASQVAASNVDPIGIVRRQFGLV